ncbi:hypothetical protein EYF80_012081 [Liparis tanakae]|uniref:Uncharacterized protein n=1 Tax=Liparis tanakae TaxID=230148 RepID=A0A4Z2IKS1_9TELE|nr:hypothetical protein EYF80_012081 [Liparis tanakae]
MERKDWIRSELRRGQRSDSAGLSDGDKELHVVNQGGETEPEAHTSNVAQSSLERRARGRKKCLLLLLFLARGGSLQWRCSRTGTDGHHEVHEYDDSGLCCDFNKQDFFTATLECSLSVQKMY